MHFNKPKRFFGADISLGRFPSTIIATLQTTETGSKMDEVILWKTVQMTGNHGNCN